MVSKKEIQRLAPGNIAKVFIAENEFNGVVVGIDSEYLELKLESGYNVCFKLKRIDKIKVLKETRALSKPKVKVPEQNKELPVVEILHTGGTIASRVDYRTGGVAPGFEAEDLLAIYPELLDLVQIRSRFFSNIFSEDLRFENYTELIKELARIIKKEPPKGFVITHGTDTMHYTASALAFAFENLPLPILLVGAQRSSDRPSSDAMLNLYAACKFIKETDFADVAICMHASTSDDFCYILPATKTKKLHSSRRDAFKAVNTLPIASVSKDSIKFLTHYRKASKESLKIYPKFEEKVAILRVRPNMHAEEISFFEEKRYKGLIIEGTGLGHIGISAPKNRAIKEALQSLINSGCIVCMTTQCVFGRVHAHVYSTARELSKMGVIYLSDMLTETAYIKLAWLLGNFSREEAIKLMPKNLRNEISERRLL